MIKSYYPAVVEELSRVGARRVLDVPSGQGWLRNALPSSVQLDGVDLFADQPKGYERFVKADMDQGVPAEFAGYDAVVSCEAIAYLTNPGNFFRGCLGALRPGGLLVLTTPNAAYAGSRLQFLLRGFLAGYPHMPTCQRSSHLPLLPWSFPLLHHFLQLAGFEKITLQSVEEKKPKRFAERFVGWMATTYARSKQNDSKLTEHEKQYWMDFGSAQANYGRHLVVSAYRPV